MTTRHSRTRPFTDGCSPAVFYAVVTPLLAGRRDCGRGGREHTARLSVVIDVLAVKLLPASWTASITVTRADEAIVWLIRLPRVLVAACVGAGLATAGAMMQSLFRNPLGEPSLIGCRTRERCLERWRFSSPGGARPRSSRCRSRLSVLRFSRLLLVYGIATRGGTTPVSTLLLAGIAVGVVPDRALEPAPLDQHRHLAGHAGDRVLDDGRARLAHVGARVAVGAVHRRWSRGGAAAIASRSICCCSAKSTAAALGVDVEASKRVLVATSALLTGASVAVAGLVGFVGLVVPHAVRLMLGPAHRTLLPASAVGGAAFLMLCDLAAAHGSASGRSPARRSDGTLRRAIFLVAARAAAEGGARVSADAGRTRARPGARAGGGFSTRSR